MRTVRWSLAALVAMIAFGAFAHSGVKNPAVMARMDGMSAVGKAMKTLGKMANGAIAFDAKEAERAVDTLNTEAARITVLFEAREGDPKSEALPAIWDNFADFSVKAAAMQDAVRAAQGQIKSQADLAPALQPIGQSCKGCHTLYRKE